MLSRRRIFSGCALCGALAIAAGTASAQTPPAGIRRAVVRKTDLAGTNHEVIQMTLELDPAQSCAAADRIAKTHLVEIDRKIEELTNLKARFSAVVAQCEGTRVETCSILKALHDCPDHGHDR